MIDEYGNITNTTTNHQYKLSKHHSGYMIVYLPMGKRGKSKAIRVHKAVAETFLPNPNHLPVVHHKDGDKSNPCCTNLEWVTHKDNTKHYLESVSRETEFFNNRKLSSDDIAKIKQLRQDHVSTRKLAAIFNVSKTTILHLINNQSYVGCY